MRRFAALVLVFALAAAPALAQGEREKGRDDPIQLFEEAVQQAFRALELMMRSIPQYSAPEILDNGDIIIRRIQPKPEKKPVPKDGDKTKT